MLRDRIIYGIKDSHVQQKLLAEKNLSLQQAVEICRTAELAREQVKVIAKQHNPSLEVDAVQTKKTVPRGVQQDQNKAKYKPNFKNHNKYLCKKCNTEHDPRSCPAFGKTCSFCKKINHYAVGCKNRNVVNSLDTECEGQESPEDL